MNRKLWLSGTALTLVAERARNGIGAGAQRKQLPAWNGMFRKDLLPLFEKEKRELETFDLYLYLTLNSPRLLGQIVFEYGTLVNFIEDWKNREVLDIGSGRSTFPHWMVSKGASVIAFEYPQQVERKIEGKFEKLNRLLSRNGRKNPHEVFGTMLELPFPDGSFDLVTSFSVIEHLDTNLPDLSYVPYPEQRRRAARVLSEMARVTKPGGYLYLTSECCDYTRATSDAWRSSYYYKTGPELSAAWPVEDVNEIFYESLISERCSVVGQNSFCPSDLNGDENRATFRGPFFSAFSVLATKNS
jgi:SAM-dependent methyltransferase